MKACVCYRWIYRPSTMQIWTRITHFDSHSYSNRDMALLEQSGACVDEGFRGFPHDTQQGHVDWHCGYRPGEHATAHTRKHKEYKE